MSGEEAPPPRRAGFWATLRAVLWSFAGIRKRRAWHEDAVQLDPRAVVVAGVLAGLAFVLGLVAIVQWVLARAGAV